MEPKHQTVILKVKHFCHIIQICLLCYIFREVEQKEDNHKMGCLCFFNYAVLSVMF